MSALYTNDVARFAGQNPFNDRSGQRRNLSHKDDFPSDLVKTDGAGNITSMPLLRNKPCFGRPERFYRGMAGGRPWTNDVGKTCLAPTPCDTCCDRSPGVFEACVNVVDERVSSSASIEHAIEDWIEASDAQERFGQRSFIGPSWRAVRRAIIASGGWTNVNDDQVKLDNLSRAEEGRKRRSAAAKRDRAAKKAAGDSSPRMVTHHYMQSLEVECDRRAAHLKSLRGQSTKSTSGTLWIDYLSDEVCDRVAHVWAAREMLKKHGLAPTKTEIARRLICMRPAYGTWDEKSLAARVGEDIKKRLARLEDDDCGEPLWTLWVYKAP